ncbi:hypothetical protein [Rhizobium sp. RAF56]|uniref:hypothetical protein n=1 Tax=Rhizobium sp. RAF56 TaxID=3233062 RepID=UPI003F9614CD
MRYYRLVCYLRQFQVCSKAKRLIDDEEFVVWIYGEDRILFCYVGQEDAVYPLPAPEQTNFQGDRFTFAIDEIDPAGEAEKVGGANNIYAAQAAYQEYLHHLNPRSVLQLRHRGRVIREQNALGDGQEWILSKRGRD